MIIIVVSHLVDWVGVSGCGGCTQVDRSMDEQTHLEYIVSKFVYDCTVVKTGSNKLLPNLKSKSDVVKRNEFIC